MTQPTTRRATFRDGPTDPLPASLLGQPDANGEVIAALPPGSYSLRHTPNGVHLVRTAAPTRADQEAVLQAVNKANRARHGLPPAGSGH